MIILAWVLLHCSILALYLITLFSDLTEEEDNKNTINLPVSAAPRQSEFKVPSVPPLNKYTNERLVLLLELYFMNLTWKCIVAWSITIPKVLNRAYGEYCLINASSLDHATEACKIYKECRIKSQVISHCEFPTSYMDTSNFSLLLAIPS